MQEFTKEELIEAMLQGTITKLFNSHNIDPTKIDYRKYLTVGREDFRQYLKNNPNLAESYFKKHVTTKAGHDSAGFVKENNKYIVFWFDHGRRRDITEFNDIIEAVIEHALSTNGLY